MTRFPNRQVLNVLKQVKRSIVGNPVQREWAGILRRDKEVWERARRNAVGGPKVLIATSTGGNYLALRMDTLLAVALTMRGAEVHFLLCDRELPACSQVDRFALPSAAEYVEHGPRKSVCDNCYPIGKAIFDTLGLTVHRYSELLTEAERESARRVASTTPYEEIPRYEFEGLSIGEHALAGALRYFAKSTLEGEPLGEPLLRRYLQAAVETTRVMRRLFDTHDYDSVSFHHGIYVPQGVISEVARQEERRVTAWTTAYRKQCFIFSHGDTYHHTMMTEPTRNWDQMEWTDENEEEILVYLKSRWQGMLDWISFHTDPQDDIESIAREIGVDFSRPCVGLLTNVTWDAQLHYPANAFKDMLDWLSRTVEYFASRTDLQLIIRVHPAELTGANPSREPVADFLANRFPDLPTNIHIIPPDSRVSTYPVMAQCDSVIIYGTKTGVELTSMGIPVIVAGEAWIRNKGITTDPATVEEYFEYLDGLPRGARLDSDTVRRARMYAYHFFLRRMIPVSFFKPTDGGLLYETEIEHLDQLLPGRDLGLDVICDGLLKGSEYIYPAEMPGVRGPTELAASGWSTTPSRSAAGKRG